MPSGCLGGLHSLLVEWLPRWGQSIWLCLNGCLGGGSCLAGLPRWGRGYLCMYSLRQSDTLNSLRQYDTKIFFLSCTNMHLY